MPIPHFTLKQLLISVTWICVGFGGVAYSLRDWNLSIRPEDDRLAEIQPFVRGVARLAGGVALVIGVIPLITTRRLGGVVAEVVAWAVPGWALGSLLIPGPANFGLSEELPASPWIGSAVVSALYLAIIAYTANPRVGKNKRSD